MQQLKIEILMHLLKKMNWWNVLHAHDIYDDNVHDLPHYVKDELNILDDHHIYDDNVHDLHHYVKDELSILDVHDIYDQNALDVLHVLHVHDE